RRLGVNRATVYDHARELGAIRIGGDKGRLRFDPAVAMQAMQASRVVQPVAQPRERPGPPRRHKADRQRHPFLEPDAKWDAQSGLWRDANGYPTHDQCWRSTG